MILQLLRISDHHNMSLSSCLVHQTPLKEAVTKVYCMYTVIRDDGYEMLSLGIFKKVPISVLLFRYFIKLFDASLQCEFIWTFN